MSGSLRLPDRFNSLSSSTAACRLRPAAGASNSKASRNAGANRRSCTYRPVASDSGFSVARSPSASISSRDAINRSQPIASSSTSNGSRARPSARACFGRSNRPCMLAALVECANTRSHVSRERPILGSCFSSSVNARFRPASRASLIACAARRRARTRPVDTRMCRHSSVFPFPLLPWRNLHVARGARGRATHASVYCSHFRRRGGRRSTAP